MRPSLISIDEDIAWASENEITAASIDSYICSLSFNIFGFADCTESYVMSRPHIIDLSTKKADIWKKIVEGSDAYYWITDENCGLSVYDPDETCGFTRVYRMLGESYQSKESVLRTGRHSKVVRAADDVYDILSNLERTAVFSAWKAQQQAVNLPLGSRSDGRLRNTTVSSSIVVTGGDGCVVCGLPATHVASTTIGGKDAKMVSLALCENDWNEAMSRPCVLEFISSLFKFQLDLPQLIKHDKLPDEIIEPIVQIISKELNASASKPEKRKNGWSVKFVMSDNLYWMLRLRSFKDYAYMLFDRSGKQRHRIDSANHHPEVPYGPSHQHHGVKSKNEKITPSFSYGVPLLDFPLLIAAKKEYES